VLDPISVAYGEIRGTLSAFALLTFDSVPDISYTFDFEYLEKVKTAQATIESYAADWADTVTLLPLAAWKQVFLTTFKNWLFNKLTFPQWYKSSWFDPHINELITKIEQLVQPTAVWRVDISTKGFYELLWEDFALENEHAVFFLHLGFSD
jgi:hypothetical protein